MFFNDITIAGNLGQDPTISKNGDYATFSIAYSEYKKNEASKTGYDTKTDWFSVYVGGKIFEYFNKMNVKKGDNVYIRGKLRKKEYTDKENIKRTSYTIIADKFIKINKEGDKQGSNSNYNNNGVVRNSGDSEGAFIGESDVIPF
jgi:single-strand DNA-binding protein